LNTALISDIKAGELILNYNFLKIYYPTYVL